MKLIQGILSCTVAAGLMACAAPQSHAGVVIGNTLYSPLNIKLTVGYYGKKGIMKTVNITSKEVLKMLNEPKGAQLAINTGNIENNSIYIISKDAVLENLTAEGILTANLQELLSKITDKTNGGFKYSASGVLTLNFYSNPQFFINESFAPLIINNPDVDQSASEDASDFWFEISGLYTYTESGSVVNNGKQGINTSLDAGKLSGIGFDADLDAPNPTSVLGDASAKGDGKIPAVNVF